MDPRRRIAGADIVTVTVDPRLANYTAQFRVLPGDVNDDGVVNSQDLVVVRNAFTGLGPPPTIPLVFLDLNGDGVIDVSRLQHRPQIHGQEAPVTIAASGRERSRLAPGPPLPQKDIHRPRKAFTHDTADYGNASRPTAAVYRLATMAVALFAISGQAGTARAGLVISAPTIDGPPGCRGRSMSRSRTTTRRVGLVLRRGRLARPGPVRAPGRHVHRCDDRDGDPLLFVLSGTTQGAGPLSLDAFPNTAILASDSEFAGPGFAEIGPGMSFGIAHVSFTVDSAAEAGDRALVLGAGTSLSDVAARRSNSRPATES